MGRFQGIGTDFYGKKDFDKINHSYIATKWFVIFLLPIYPKASYRLKKIKQQSHNYVTAYTGSTSYQIIENLSLQKSQIFRTYLFAYGFLASVVLSLALSAYKPEFILVFLGLFATILIWTMVKN